MTAPRKYHIRTLLYLFVSFLTIVAVTGCSNEPVDLTGRSGGVDTDTIDPPEEDTDLIVNTWALTDVQLADAAAQLKIANQTLTHEAMGEGSDYNLQVVFDKNGNVTSTGSYVQNISVKLGLQTLDETREVKAEELFGSGTWARSETILTLSDGVEPQELEILELTENSLILRTNTTQTDTINNIPVTLTGTVTASFSAVEG